MSTAPALDERLHRDAIKTLLDVDHVYDHGMVPGLDGNPGDPPRIHWLLSLERRFADPRKSGRAEVSGWRVAIVGVGRTPDEARHALLVATQAVEATRIEVDDTVSTPVAHESSTAVERDDDGWWSGLAIFTYAC